MTPRLKNNRISDSNIVLKAEHAIPPPAIRGAVAPHSAGSCVVNRRRLESGVKAEQTKKNRQRVMSPRTLCMCVL